MKRLILSVLITLSYFSSFAQNFPEKSNKLVTDLTQTLNATQIAQLERKLVAFDDSTSNQIAVIIVKTVGDNYDNLV